MLRARGRWLLRGLTAACMALGACAPIIETAVRPLPDAISADQAGRIVVATSSFVKTKDSLDPAVILPLLRKAAEKRRPPVVLAPAGAGEGVGDGDSHVRLDVDQLDYSISPLKLPPEPPLGLGILYPFILHRMLTRDYLRLELSVRADLTVQDPAGGVVSRITVSERSFARVNMFKYGEEAAVGKLTEVAVNNLFGQVLELLIHLTNPARDDNKSP